MIPQNRYTGLVLALFASFPLWAQSPTIQDCLGAIPVCQPVYSESQSPDGAGNYTNEIGPGQTCNDFEDNSIWYIFTANSDGELGFLITPNNLNDDYDWVLFNITNASCADIRTNSNLIVSCNAAGGSSCNGLTGATGASNSDNQGAGCSFGNTAFNDLVPMQAGETFVLLVNNWTGSPNGFTINFGLSTGLGIFDQTTPGISEVTRQPVRCGDTRIDITFDEFIQCSTIHAYDFRLEGPGGPYTLTASSAICQQGGRQTQNVRLVISPPIASLGTFTLFVDPLNSGSLLDLCGNQMVDTTLIFEVNTPTLLDFNLGADTSLVCEGDTLLLDASPFGDAFLWETGSTNPVLPVSQAGVYSVTVSDACGSGVDSIEIIVQQEPPVVDLGPNQDLCPGDVVTLDATNDLSTYLWQDGNTDPIRTITAVGGFYRVEVTNACGTTPDSTTLTYIPPLNLTLQPELSGCAGDTLFLDFTRPFATYQWENGSTDAQRILTQNGQYSITVTTPCEQWTATTEAFFLVDPVLDLGDDVTLCFGDTLVLSSGIPASTYLWQDGSTQADYTVSGPGEYRLRVITPCNELNDAILIEYINPIGTELGRDTFLCEKDVLFLNAQAGVPATYRWEDGSTDPLRRIQGPGVYVVEVSSDCQTVSDTLTATLCEQCQAYAPNAFSPNDDGVNDNWRLLSDCPFERYNLRIYDRWGGLVFATLSPEEGWKGKSGGQTMPPGAYVFLLEYTVIEDGYARDGIEKGTVTLIR